MKNLTLSQFVTAALVGVLWFSVMGCHSNAVVFSTTTRIALEFGVTETGTQGVQLGIDRFEGVLMPMVFTNLDSKKRETSTQAYPVYAFFEYSTGGLTPASATNGDAMTLRQSFATGRASTNAYVRARVKNDFSRSQEGIYMADEAGDQLRCFWKPDGINSDPNNTKALQDWIKFNNVESPSITFFLRSDRFADLRKKAVIELQVPPCKN